MSDIDTATVDSLKVLDPNGRLEKRTWLSVRTMSEMRTRTDIKIKTRQGLTASIGDTEKR